MRIRESVSQATQVKHIASCGSVVVRRGSRQAQNKGKVDGWAQAEQARSGKDASLTVSLNGVNFAMNVN